MVGRNWKDDWNNIQRNVLFKDDELKRLMLIPEGTKIMDFVQKYFTKAAVATNPVTSQDVRIIYHTYKTNPTNNPYVTVNEMSFDIYVKLDKLYGAERDGLSLRTELIANRLNNLLTKHRFDSYNFRCSGESESPTSVIGYTRYTIIFEYKRTY